jgi:molybdopterin synthase catalytic subunit
MSYQIHIIVLYFASAKDATGVRTETFELSKGTTIRDLLSKVSSSHPKIINLLNTVQVSVNYRVVDMDAILKENDEVALLPPISGG